jgi:signal transduction histidine kinase/ActR/RegA family two-component response regulator
MARRGREHGCGAARLRDTPPREAVTDAGTKPASRAGGGPRAKVCLVENQSQGAGLPPTGGETGALMRAFDWSQTDVGPPAGWPRSLTSYVSMILEMPTPAIVFWGPNQTQLYNDGYAVIMGPRHPAYLASSYAECWPETYPVLYPCMLEVLETGEVVQFKDHLVTLTRHGFPEEAYFTFTFSPLRDDDGNIAGVFQPVVEVTDTVLSERRSETLRRLSAQVETPGALIRGTMAALSESAIDVPMALVYLWDPSARELSLAAHTGLEVLDVNALRHAPIHRLAEQTIETTSPHEIDSLEAALGQPHHGHWPEPTRAAYVLPLRHPTLGAPAGVVVLGISPRLHFDGKYRDFLGAIARELSARIATENAGRLERELLAREREARRDAELQKEHFALLLSQAPTPMVVLRGPTFVIEHANLHACRVWMREHAEVIRKPLFDALPELRGQVFEELLEQVYRTGESATGRELEARFCPPGGELEEVYLSFVYAPLRTPAGDVDGVLVIAFDVTQQVRAREQLDELRNAAETANRAKDEFFAVLGHELRNPLAPILTALEIMRMHGCAGIEREREVIERQARHLVRLVDDLLDVSRITRGKIDLKKVRIEIAEVVAHAVEMTLPMIEQRRHELTIDVAPAGLGIEVDPVRLAQAIANLLTNAAKYTEPAGRLTIASRRRADHIELLVRDTGIGMSPEMLPHVFDVFVQARQALDRSHGGLGLGLAIVRGIVHLHGGTVEARSEGLGQGAEFVVTLPAAPSMTHEVAIDPVRAKPSSLPDLTGRRTVLVVDDNQDAADLLATYLEGAGYRVVVAYDAPSALRIASEHPPDVALLDIGLPVMNGYELAARLRARASLEKLVLVAITGYGQESDRKLSRDAGFDAHLIKPVDLVEVEVLVRRLSAARENPRT